MPGYNPSAIEKKWQQRWADERVFATDAAGPRQAEDTC